MRFGLVLALLVAATALVTVRSTRRAVSLRSLRQLWSDAVRDADQPGMRLTRLSDAEEMRLGEELIGARGQGWVEDADALGRIGRVAERLLPHVHRRGIGYQFHLLESDAINAFALPGGQILVTTGMMGFVQSDAELAETLGHEIAHVDLRHAVEHYQYQYRLGFLPELFHRLLTLPFSADQEMDADAEGMRLAVEGGYDAAAGAALFERMRRELHEVEPERPTTPAGEIVHSVGDAVVSYFRTHPPSEERARRLRELAGRRAR